MGDPLGGADQGLFPQPHQALALGAGEGRVVGCCFQGARGKQHRPPATYRRRDYRPSHMAPRPLRAIRTPTPSLDWGPTPPGQKDSMLLGLITWLLFCLWVAQPECGPEYDTQDGILGPPEGHSRLPSV